MDDEDIIIIDDDDDDDLRNATVISRGRGRGGRGRGRGGRGRGVRVIGAGSRGRGSSAVDRRYRGQPGGSRPRRPGATRERTHFSDLDTGDLVASAVKVLAALDPLPASPVIKGDPKTDLENLVAYQANLAVHAKRAQQLGALGEVIARLL